MAASYRDFLLANIPVLRNQAQPPPPEQGMMARLLAMAAANQAQQQPRPQVPLPPTMTPQQAVSMIPRAPFDQYGAPNEQLQPVAPPYIPPVQNQPPPMPNVVQQQMTPGGAPQPQVTTSPVYQRLIEMGNRPEQVIRALQQVPPDDPPDQAFMQAQQLIIQQNQQQFAETSAANPGSLPGAFGQIASDIGQSPIGQAVGGAASTAASAVAGFPLIPTLAPGGEPGTIGDTARTVIDVYEKPYRAVAARTGEDIYDLSNGGSSPGLSNPWFYVDTNIEDWSQNPENKEKIKAIFEEGLDINGDGTVDIKGGEAVWMVYQNEVHPNFIDRIITDLAFDPLFLGSFIAPAASAGRVGAQTAGEMAIMSGMSKTERIAKAVDDALAKITRAGDIGNTIADAPLTLTIGAARGVVQGTQKLPGVFGKFIGDLSRPAPNTLQTTATNTAVDVADVAQMASAIPNTNVPFGGQAEFSSPLGGMPPPRPDGTSALPPFTFNSPGPGRFAGQIKVPGPNRPIPLDTNYPDLPSQTLQLPEGGAQSFPELAAVPGQPRRPSGAIEAIPVPSGDIQPQVTQSTVSGQPSWRIVQGDETYRVRTIPGKGYQVEQKQGTKFIKIGDPLGTSDEAVAEATRLAGGTATPYEPDVPSGQADLPEMAAVPEIETPDVTPETSADGINTTTQGSLPETPTIPPHRALPTDGITPEERIAGIRDGRWTVLTPVRGDGRLITKAWEMGDLDETAWKAFEADYAPKANAHVASQNAIEAEIRRIDDAIANKPLPGQKRPWMPQAERDALYALKQQHVADQVISGIEHTVTEMAPAVKTAFGELPDIAPLGRKQATTKSGKSSYQQENLPYLYQRYVFTENEKDAAKIIEVLRQRSDLTSTSWADDALTRLMQSRARLKEVRGSGGIMGSDAAGIVYNPLREAQRLARQTNELADRLLGVQPQALPTEPNFALDDMGASERFLADTEPGIQALRGAMPDDVARQLDTPIRDIKIKSKGKWVDATPREAQAFAEKSGITLPETGGFKDTRIQIEEMTQLDLLQRIMAKMPDATSAEISQAFADRVVDLTGMRVPPRMRLAPGIEQARGAISTTSNIARESALYNVVTGGRGHIGDAGSDYMRMVMEGHLSSAVMSNVDYVRKLRGLESVASKISRDYGMDLPAKLKVKRGRTEVEVGTRTSTHKAISNRFGVTEGSTTDKTIGVLAGFSNSQLMARSRNAADTVRREAIYVSHIEKHEWDMYRTFKERGRSWSNKHGILPSSYDAYMFDLGQRFRPDQIRPLMTELGNDAGLAADQAVNFADRLTRDWQQVTRKLRNDALAESDRILLSYERTNLDSFLGNFIFYHYWMSRAVPAYTRIALRNPEIAAMWIRTWEDVRERTEAAGYPDHLKGYVRFLGSADGWNYAMNPLALIMPLVDMMPDAEREGWFETLTQFVAVNPIISAAAAAIGLTDDVVDPLMSYSVRNMIFSGINVIRAHTGRGQMTDPYESLLRKTTDFANQMLTAMNLPMSKRRVYMDPAVFNTSEIQYNVAGVVAEQTGVPIDQWVVPSKENPDGGREYQIYVAAIRDHTAGIDNPIYQEGYRRWADADFAGRGLNSLIPGGVRTRYGPRDELMTNEDLTDQQKTFKSVVDSGSPEAAGLTLLDEEYHGIGTERQQALSTNWADIAYETEYPDAYGLSVAGTWITFAEIKALDKEQRIALADLWVTEQDGTDELKEYRDDRSAFLTKHPEYGQFEEWKDSAYKDWEDKGGLRAFRLNRAAGNDNFRKEMESHRTYLKEQRGVTDATLLEAELDQWAVGINGYMAAQGIRNDVYDPDPIGTGDQATVDAIASSGGGGGFTSSARKAKTTTEKLTADIATFETDMKLVEQTLKNYGIDLGPDGLSGVNGPYAVQSLGAFLGEMIPQPTALMKTYQEWATFQPKGADTSPKAFGAYLDLLAAQDSMSDLLKDYAPAA